MGPPTINKWNVKNKPFGVRRPIHLARLSWCWVTRIFTERKAFWVANGLYSVFLLYSLYCCTGSRNSILPDIPTVIKLGKDTKNKSERPLKLMVAKLEDNPLMCARGNKAAERAGKEDAGRSAMEQQELQRVPKLHKTGQTCAEPAWYAPSTLTHYIRQHRLPWQMLQFPWLREQCNSLQFLGQAQQSCILVRPLYLAVESYLLALSTEHAQEVGQEEEGGRE